MKKAAALLLAALLLTGCSQSNAPLEHGMSLRTRLLSAAGCSFDADITADYGDAVHRFSMECTMDSGGTVKFTVQKPDSISGITGILDAQTGGLTFDDSILYFPMLADDQVTPISAPWLLMKTLRSGCITSAGQDEKSIRLSIDDSYEDDALHLDIWLDEADCPIRAEVLFRERKILSLDVKNFRIE